MKIKASAKKVVTASKNEKTKVVENKNNVKKVSKKVVESTVKSKPLLKSVGKKLNHLMDMTTFVKESYLSDIGDKFQSAKDNLVRKANSVVSDKVSGVGANIVSKIGGLPKEEMEKFIVYIKSNCEGEVITIDKIKELVKPMLRFGMGLTADRARDTAVFTDNFDFVSIVSDLIYNELESRGELDCTSFEDDEIVDVEYDGEYDGEYDDDDDDDYDDDLDSEDSYRG